MEQFWVEAIGYGGTVFTIASYSMRTIIPLRIAGILSSVFFISYALLMHLWPMLLTELVILPLNILRLFQMFRLLRQVEEAAKSDFALDWLEPFARNKTYEPGQILFHKGDYANHLLLIHTGRFRLKEAGIELGSGELVGELGFLSRGNQRTMTLECIEAGSAGSVTYKDIQQLYYQNPKFGFFFLRLISNRLFENLERARQKTATEAA
jgi:CRP/FNR family cyclic AMP-dependent transcriptional regulator